MSRNLRNLPRPSRIEPQSTQRPQSIFFKRLGNESFYEYFILSAFSRLSAFCGSFLLLGNEDPSFSGSSADEEKRMNEEEAKSAEILF
jgi:hypothetical protein